MIFRRPICSREQGLPSLIGRTALLQAPPNEYWATAPPQCAGVGTPTLHCVFNFSPFQVPTYGASPFAASIGSPTAGGDASQAATVGK